MTNGHKFCKVTYDNSLSHVLDGFMCQVVGAIAGTTQVYKKIGCHDELVYRGCDDAQEMQIQMMADYHLQQFNERFRETLIDYIIEQKLVLPGRETPSKAAMNIQVVSEAEMKRIDTSRKHEDLADLFEKIT